MEIPKGATGITVIFNTGAKSGIHYVEDKELLCILSNKDGSENIYHCEEDGNCRLVDSFDENGNRKEPIENNVPFTWTWDFTERD